MSIQIHVAARTSIGLVRSRNEDAFLIADLVEGAPDLERGQARFTVGQRGALLAVSDGMGGHSRGDVAAAMTLDTLYRTLVNEPDPASSGIELVHATKSANTEVYRAEPPQKAGHMGATVTAVLVRGARAYIAEVGDSRAYVLRHGTLHRLTFDQSYAELAVTIGALAPEDVASSPLRNVLVQAIGQEPDIDVALSTLELRARDCLVVVSDGVTSKLMDDEIAQIILSSRTLAKACDALIEHANARGGDDNATVLLGGVSSGAPDVTESERFSGTFHVVKPFDPRTRARAGEPLSRPGSGTWPAPGHPTGGSAS